MKWDKESMNRLRSLLEGAKNLKALGVKKTRRPPPPPNCPDFLFVPYSNQSSIVRTYLCKYESLSTKEILGKISEECFVDVPPTLVSAVRMILKRAKKPPDTKMDLIKVPKEVALKLLVLGIP